jgi:hypothetical protein
LFTKRHEEEIAEIKALTLELGQRVEQILDELAHIRQAPAAVPVAEPEGKPAKRKAARGPKAARARADRAERPKSARAKAAKRGRVAASDAAEDGGRPRKQRAQGERKRRQRARAGASPRSAQE